MTRACLFLAVVSLVAAPSAYAQNTQRVDRTYVSVSPVMMLRVEPIDTQRVRVGTWEASGFSVSIDQFGTRIRSTGEARSTAPGPAVTVDSVEMVSVGGRIYLFLRNMRQ